ncbi:MAG: lipocalin-like domain-containing protein [Desulfobacterales bacterium]|jgi:predicted secreted hydrolase
MLIFKIVTIILATTFMVGGGINACLVEAAESAAYLSVAGPCNLEFPKDHGPHPGYRTEWWYYTGNLQAASGDMYGFQLTFFRTQISPPQERKKWPQPASAWRTQQVYLAHSAISHISKKKHLQAELISREALNMAGANHNEDASTIFLKNWSARIGPDRHQLKVHSDEFSYELTLTPEKPPVLHGNAGYSLKGSTPERASCYYSFTRLKAEGDLSIGKNIIAVKGSAWMDHEYSTAPLEPGIRGWDWFSLQLSDQTEVMAFVLRKDKGEIGPASSATDIGNRGQNRHIRSHEFLVTVRDTWKSPHSKAIYPAGWRLQILSSSLDLIITPNLADQEMRTPASTGVVYWEGSVSIEGTRAGRPVVGQGYVELTGYAKPFDAPM